MTSAVSLFARSFPKYSNIVSKFFNHVNTSSRQFGFKQGVGCADAIGVVKKVINYFNKKRTTVNIAAIDLKKAFDKVNHFCLLSVLLDKV